MKKINILVVEDEALIAASLVKTLSSLGYTVHQPVATGEEAIRSVKTQQTDLVLMDIQLIGPMDGIEAAEKIRKIADIPILYLTAYTDDLRLKKAQLTEPYGYIVKPANSRELHATIQMALYKHGLDKKLKESEEQLRSTLASMDDLVFTLDENGIFIGSYHPVMTTLYVMPEQFIGKSFRDVLPEELAEHIQKAINDVKITGTTQHVEYSLLLNGKSSWFSTKISPRYSLKGTFNGVTVVARDVTERKKAEEALRESEEKYRTLIDTLNEGIWVIDKKEITTFVNPKMAMILGYTVEEMTGRSLFTFMDEEGRRICEQNLKRRQQGIKEQHYFEFLKKDGVRIYASLEATPITGKDGEYLGAIAGVTDITERKQAEEALQKSELHYRELADSITDLFFALDYDLRYTHWNKASENLTGIKSTDAIGRSISDLFTDTPDIRKAKEIYLEVLKTREPRTFENQFITGDRNIFFEIRVYPSFGGISVFTRDITERKVAEYALSQANKKLNLLSSITRHDINNQLTVLMGFLTILKKKQPDPALNEYFVKVSAAAQRISSMILFTKEYESIGVKAPVWQDCRTVIDTAAKQAPLGKVMVQNDLPPGTEVFADPLIVKVFYNLMDNAVRYGGKITTIRFCVEERKSDHVVVCEDDGDGVVAEEKEKIFERGFGKNTGLGLALAREILDITGITIKETGEPGKGARFEMAVPKRAWRTAETGNSHPIGPGSQ